MKIEALMEKAKAAGFTHVAPMAASTIELRQEVRDMCAVNSCGMYGKRWSCPPGCGELEDLRKRLQEYSGGVLIQSVGNLEDNFDAETMMETETHQKERLLKLQKMLLEEQADVLVLGAGCCTHCRECTYPDAPCRFPEKACASMEAYGLFVTQVCRDNGLYYHHGERTVTYTACVLF